MKSPQILERKTTIVSPWVTLLEKTVSLEEGSHPEVYHSVTGRPYVAVVAVTGGGTVVIVRQYRPAVERYTWEFPAGTVDDGETAAAAAARELLEETGLVADELCQIGDYDPDTGRLSLGSTGYVARCTPCVPPRAPEQGIEMRYVTVDQLFDMVRTGEFRHQLHVALIGSALLHGHLALDR